jgi:hypothetical protein
MRKLTDAPVYLDNVISCARLYAIQIHLPRPEQSRSRLSHHLVIKRPVPRWLLKNNFSGVGRIDRDPAA